MHTEEAKWRSNRKYDCYKVKREKGPKQYPLPNHSSIRKRRQFDLRVLAPKERIKANK